MKLVAPEERVHQRWEYLVDDVPVYPTKSEAAIPPRGCRPLPEDYAEGQQGIHVHLRVETLGKGGGAGGVSRNLCAVFIRTHVDFDSAGEVGRVGKVSVGAGGDLRDVRHSMFVHVGKLVELPQGVRRERIPSCVRLQPLDDCLRSWVNAPDFVTTFPHLPFPSTKNGELRPSVEGVGQGATSVMPYSEFVGKVVKGGAEVVEAIPDDEAELYRDWLGESDVHDLLTALTVEMTIVSVRVSVSPLTNFRLKAVQVMGGPS
jgi:hypothetical protein